MREVHTQQQQGDIACLGLSSGREAPKVYTKALLKYSLVLKYLTVGTKISNELTGKSVCGARWNKGVIQEFESYEFAPKSWTLTRWHFCSIDTWLQGTQ